MITNRNNYEKIDSMKKLHIQKSISWCEKHDISCVKLHSSNNIFLSNIYEDGTPISVLKHNNNNNAFLKNKSSNFVNTVYHGGGAYNKPKINIITEQESSTNETTFDVKDVSEINNTNSLE